MKEIEYLLREYDLYDQCYIYLDNGDIVGLVKELVEEVNFYKYCDEESCGPMGEY